ncbi:AAA family ATPase [bacterium]|nr:AAA family ATPase [Candidatus Elulimicrobium humile]
MKELWVEKYRPKTLEGYVFRDDHQRKQIETWVKDKSIPHLLLSGNAGIGKTTLAKILINELGIEEYDVLEMNASRTNSVDDVRNKITNFVQMIPFGPFKVVLLDEADYLSPNAQAALRGVMEEFHQTARFILTCNYPHMIIPAIHSRTQTLHFEKTDQTEYTARVATILVEENVEFDLDTLDLYVKVAYPDLRKCIQLVQQNSIGNKLVAPSKGDEGESDWKFDMVGLFKAGKIMEARKLLCGKVRAEEILEIYSWLYNNIEIFGDERQQDTAVLVIKQGIVDHPLCADPEINLAATLIKLSRIE